MGALKRKVQPSVAVDDTGGPFINWPGIKNFKATELISERGGLLLVKVRGNRGGGGILVWF